MIRLVRRGGSVLVLVGVLWSAVAPPGLAAPGDLDTSFGRNGKVTTNFTPRDDMAFGIAIQPNGRIVTAGTAGFRRFALSRYRSNGTLDPSFGGNGKVTTRFTPGLTVAHAVALQSDGKIVAAGSAGFAQFALVRYETDGSLDTSFGENGRVLTDLTGGDDIAFGIAIQPDGKVLVAGRAAGARGRFALVRYIEDGSLDPSFGGDGKVLVNFTSRDDAARDLAIQANGRIVVAGYAGGRRSSRFALARFMPDGTLDTSFSDNGKVVTRFTRGQDLVLGIASQSDRRIVAAGHAGGTRSSPGNHRFAVARYRPNGTLDRTFGSNGKQMVDFTVGDDWAQDLGIQADGKIVAVGRSNRAGGSFALARLIAQ